MFNSIVRQLVQNAQKISSRYSCLDMFGLHTFQILELIYVPTEQIQDVFFNLRDWELQEDVAHRWDMEPSGIFLLTRVFQACKRARIDCWGAMALVQNLSFCNVRLQIGQYAPLSTTTAQSQEIFDSLHIWHQFSVSQKEKSRAEKRFFDLFDPSLQHIAFQVRVNIGWWKSVTDNENHELFLIKEQNQKRLAYVVQQWKSVAQSQKQARFFLQLWIQRRNVQKKVIAQWKFVTINKRKILFEILRKWRLLVHTKQARQCNAQQARQTKTQRKFFQRWLHIVRKNKHSVKKHQKMEWMQLERVTIHFLTKVLVTCFEHVCEHVHASIFMSELRKYDKLLVEVTKNHNNLNDLIWACQKLRDSQFPQCMKTTVLLTVALHRCKSFLQLFAHLNQAVRNFQEGLEDIPNFLLPSLIPNALVQIQAMSLHCDFVTRNNWQERTCSLRCTVFLPEETAVEITKAWIQCPAKKTPVDLIRTLNSLIMIIQYDGKESDGKLKEQTQMRKQQKKSKKDQAHQKQELFPIHFN